MHRLISVAVLAACTVAAGCGGGGTSSPSPPVAAPLTPPPGSPSSAPSALPSVLPTQTATATPSPPAAMASAYAAEAADINNFASAVAAQCPATSSASTRVDIELLQSNGNPLTTTLPGMSIAQAQSMATNAVAWAIEERRVLPGIGVMINPVYPVLVQNQANAPSWWNTAANYPVFAAYYTTLAQGLAQNGIPYDVETNIAFPSYSGQNYSGVSIAQLETGIAEDASNVLALMSPQYLNLSSEPLTLAQNTGQNSLDTASGFTAFVSAIRSAVVVPGGSTTKLGAGSADWSPLAFLTSLEGLSGLAYNDLHLYPPDFLTSSEGGIVQVAAMDPATTGKPAIITENWDEKDAGVNYGAGQAPLLEQQNTYSFWAPLDAQYIPAMMRLARCHNVAVIDFWYQWELFAYLDYASASTLTPQGAQAAIASAAQQAAAAGTLSPSGQALLTALTGRSAASLRH